jgi:hypothetical protein
MASCTNKPNWPERTVRNKANFRPGVKTGKGLVGKDLW